MDDQIELLSAHFGKIASLIGERSRAVMLWNLLDGRAYTAGELALCADISKQACSNHLAQLVDAEILRVEKQGRHRYYTFASDQAALVIEHIASLVPHGAPEKQPDGHLNHASRGIRYARTCYDHLAGKLGVMVFDAFINMGIVEVSNDVCAVSSQGETLLKDIGVDVKAAYQSKRKFAYPCLDWSERRHHLGGALGASVLHAFLENDWIRKMTHGREIVITSKGEVALRQRIGIQV